MADRGIGGRIAAVLGLDLGTGSAKAVLLDVKGNELSRGASEYRHPSVGAAGDAGAMAGLTAEIDAEVWWTSIRAAAAEALSAVRADVLAIGLTGQMHGVVALDARGRALRPAITWIDDRSTHLMPDLDLSWEPFRTSLINPLAGLTASFLFWLSQTEPQIIARSTMLLQPKDWLGFRLTGEAQTEASDASATGMWNFREMAWHRDFVRAIGVKDDALPVVLGAGATRGVLTSAAATDLGLPAGIPVAAGLADTAASQLGSGIPVLARVTTLTLGTGAQLCQVTAVPPVEPANGLLVLAGPADDQKYVMAGTFSAGLTLDWARRLWAMDWTDFFDHAFAPSSGEAGPVFAPFVAGERLYPGGSSFSAAWIDMRLPVDASALVRSVVEGSVYAVRMSRDVLLSDPQLSRFDRCTLVGGGARDPRMRQLVADVMGTPMCSPGVFNSSARGAAICGAVAAGWCSTLADGAEMFQKPIGVVEPDSHAVRMHDRRFGRFADLVESIAQRNNPR